MRSDGLWAYAACACPARASERLRTDFRAFPHAPPGVVAHMGHQVAADVGQPALVLGPAALRDAPHVVFRHGGQAAVEPEGVLQAVDGERVPVPAVLRVEVPVVRGDRPGRIEVPALPRVLDGRVNPRRSPRSPWLP